MILEEIALVSLISSFSLSLVRRCLRQALPQNLHASRAVLAAESKSPAAQFRHCPISLSHTSVADQHPSTHPNDTTTRNSSVDPSRVGHAECAEPSPRDVDELSPLSLILDDSPLPPQTTRTRSFRSGRPHVGHPPASCRELRPGFCLGIASELWKLTGCRFEKSLYDLIRGLRNHKGNEKEYIQKSLKECRAEIRGSDMGRSPLDLGSVGLFMRDTRGSAVYMHGSSR